jgi:DNA topoisomerase-1
MEKNLVIVESPAKAKTIEKFLGKDFKVMSSYGHIRDLKEKSFGIDIEHNFAPEYVIPAEKKKLVGELKKASSAATQVWLASDEDREGEAIAWHLFDTLGLKDGNTKRIVFHEITKTAILNAIEHPRSIDMNLVDAQQARRVLDRIVGFELSPVLWKKVKPALSAGRVQSVAVRLTVEREREIINFESKASYHVSATFILPDGTTLLNAKLNRRMADKNEAVACLESFKNSSFVIEDITKKPFKKSPAPPFTTSTLQQEAARKIGLSVSQTMRIAQKLYEAGHITYMRTDSVNLSDLALGTTKAAILNNYGEKYHKFRTYHTKSKGAQEAHEAIRPTDMKVTQISGSTSEKHLYELIYKRTIACQMADAELERTTITVNISGKSDEKFIATGEVVVFDGFLHVYMESQDEDADNESENCLQPSVKANEALTMKTIVATERFTQKPARYNEASLVHRLEELGIGRPSTYAPTIQTIQNREYVVKGNKDGENRTYNILTLKGNKITESDKTEVVGSERNKLVPTDMGIIVNDFLTEYFPNILDYNFTANVEKEFDSIAEGELEWTKVLHKFYDDFHPTVDAAITVRTEHRVGEREIGTDPASGLPVFVKMGRYGSVVQIGKADADKKTEKPRFASLLKSQSLDTITLEEALELFKLPRVVGEYEGEEIIAGTGRFGPYIRHNGVFVSMPKGGDPLTITEQEAVMLIEEKRQKASASHIKTFEAEPKIDVINGRFGPYLACNGTNYRLPKGSDPAALTEEECRKIIAEAADRPPSKGKKGFGNRKKK